METDCEKYFICEGFGKDRELKYKRTICDIREHDERSGGEFPFGNTLKHVLFEHGLVSFSDILRLTW
jgi:hypothetical protein